MIYTHWYLFLAYGIGCCVMGVVYGYLLKAWLK